MAKSIGLATAFIAACAAVDPAVVSTQDPAVKHAIEQQLESDCGVACVDMFHEMLGWVEGSHDKDAAPSWSHALEKLMQREYNSTMAIYAETQSNADGLTSFVEASIKSGSALSVKTWFPFDTPCYDAASCKAVELFSHTCSYGSVATLATYQVVNLAIHVFGVIMQVLCGVIHVHKYSIALASSMATCQMPANLLSKLVGASNQIWESVKGMTKVCKVQGNFLISS